jgi:WD40 repeat protein
MTSRHLLLVALLALLGGPRAQAQQDILPPSDLNSLVRLEGDGPTARVTALAFAPGGRTLYTAGFDKLVRVWNLKNGAFVGADQTFRIPIGPDRQGVINALAVSPDGLWLAVGGNGMVRGLAGFKGRGGRIFPVPGLFQPDMRRDMGLIYLFNTKNLKASLLIGHTGPIKTLAFGPGPDGPVLVSVAEKSVGTKERFVGEVCAWNFRKSNEPLRLPDLPTNPARPGALVLAPARPGALPQVVIAAGDGLLRVCDLSDPALQYRTAQDGRFNVGLAGRPGDGRFFSGSFQPRWEKLSNLGKVTAWNLNGGIKGTPAGHLRSVGVEADIRVYYPRDMVVLPTVPATPSVFLAVVTREQTNHPVKNKLVPILNGERDYLDIFELPPGEDLQWRRHLDLDSKGGYAPLLAVAPDGAHLAVARNSDQQVKIYPIADLVRPGNQAPTPQFLPGGGHSMRQVAFYGRTVKDKQQLALAFGARAVPEYLFDFANNTLTGKLAGWQALSPQGRNWKVVPKVLANGQQQLLVYQGPKLTMSHTFPRGWSVTARALSPEAPVTAPLLAVGLHGTRSGEELIDLFDAATGRQVRRLQGHLGAVHALAFASGGKLLASAAEDQTVAVWSLSDLGDTWNMVGRLPGFAIERDDAGNLKFKDNDGVVDSSPPAPGLQQDFILDGEVVKGQVKPFAAPLQVYELFWGHKPGTTVTLQVRDDTGNVRRVNVQVAQGVDERKPLFYLFVGPRTGAALPQWVAWNPVGVFDSSGIVAEKYLGVHFNNGKLEKPASHAPINEYREKFRMEGVLKYLLDEANLEKGMKAWKQAGANPVPHLGIVGLAPVQPGASGRPRVNDAKVKLELWITGYRPHPADRVEFQHRKAGEWEKIRQLPGARHLLVDYRFDQVGDHEFRVVLNLHGTIEQPLPEYLTLRYLPAPPRLKYLGPTGEAVTKADFPFKALVETANEGQAAQVTLVHKAGDRTERHPFSAKGRTTIEKQLTLAEGDNVVTLVAQNDNVPADMKEPKDLVFRVKYTKIRLANADITVDRVVPLQDSTARSPQQVQPGERITVDVPRVLLKGNIKGKEELSVADLIVNGDAKSARRLAKFNPKSSTCTIADVVELKPGLQTIRIAATTANSEPVSTTLELYYDPPLPRVTLTQLGPKDGFQKQINLEANMTPSDIPLAKGYDLDVTVLVNNKKLNRPFKADSTTRTLQIPNVMLNPRDNIIEVQLRHEWGKVPSVASLTVPYLRPPMEIKVTGEQLFNKSLANLKASVQSEPSLTKGKVWVLVNGALQRADNVTIRPNDNAAAKNTWLVELKGVPLQTGPNALELFVQNDEAICREPGRLKLVAKPTITRPRIVFDSPSERTLSLREPELEFTFRVKSNGVLRRVVLREDGKDGETYYQPSPAQLAKLKPDGDGYYHFKTPKVRLKWSQNALILEALNDGGPAEPEPRTISIFQMPVEVTINYLQQGWQNGRVVQPDSRNGGKVVFTKPLAGGKVLLHGTVRWSSLDDERLKQTQWIYIYVNGFRQFPVKLDAWDGKVRERTFSARLLLNADKNKVEVELPSDLPKDSASRPDFSVVCEKPVRKQYLHVVIVAPQLKYGVPPRDEESLKQQVIKALGIKQQGDEYSTDVFEKVIFHTLVGERCYWFDVTGRLGAAREQIYQRSSQGDPNDVVMFYYQGIQTVKPADTFFWTYETRPNQESETALGLKFLQTMFSSKDSQSPEGIFTGAQMVLLDVTTLEQKAEVAQEEKLKDALAMSKFAAFRNLLETKPKSPDWARLLSEMQKQLNLPQDPVQNIRDLAARMQAELQNQPPNFYDQYLPAGLQMQLRK